MNAQETLKKIAEAVGVVLNPQKEQVAEAAEQAAEAVEVAVEAVETTDKVEEAVAEPTEDVIQESEAVAEDEPKVEEPKEEAQVEEVKADTPVDGRDARIEELERQLNVITEMMNGVLKPEEAAEVVPEVPSEEPKGLTHSPEAPVAKRAPKIGGAKKGSSIQSSVYRYINNN